VRTHADVKAGNKKAGNKKAGNKKAGNKKSRAGTLMPALLFIVMGEG